MRNKIKKRIKKGFTIVELVIVIAIVAVLASVLIPTFASLIDKVNRTADIQGASQLNNALIQGSVMNPPTSLEDVIKILEAAGYKDSLLPITSRFRYFWYQKENENVILLVELPKFVDDLLVLEVGELPNNYKAKVWYPDGRDTEGTLAHDLEGKLNRLLQLIWNYQHLRVDEKGNWVIPDNMSKEEFKNALIAYLNIDEEHDLYSIFQTLFNHDLAQGEPNNSGNVNTPGGNTPGGNTPGGNTPGGNGSDIVAVTGVTLDQTSLTLTKGGTATLEATVSPGDATDKTVTWSSNATNVATVSGGVVTAVGEGTAKITVTTVDGSYTANCEVNVTAATVPVESVTLPDDLTLTEGGRATLEATVSPGDATDKTVTWSSNPEGVVEVVDGVVIALKAGTATITATAGGKSATCTVTVVPKITSTNMSLNETEFILAIDCVEETHSGCNEAFLTVNLPAGADGLEKIWEVTQTGEVISFDQETGQITAISGGTATITVEVQGVKKTCTVTVCAAKFDTTELEGKVGVNNQRVVLQVYPGIDEHLSMVFDDKVINFQRKFAPNDTQQYYSISFRDPGSTIVKVTVKIRGHIFTEQCNVKAIMPAESISLNKDEVHLATGETYFLEASLTPDNSNVVVEWESSKPEVATVDSNGKVTTHKVGQTIITAKVKGEEIQAQCTVHVHKVEIYKCPNPASPNDVELVVGSLECSNTTFLKIKVDGNNEFFSGKVDVSSSNDNVANATYSSGTRMVKLQSGGTAGDATLTFTIPLSETQSMTATLLVQNTKGGTLAGFLGALHNGATAGNPFKLTGDLILSGQYVDEVPAGVETVIDLNGHTLTISKGTNAGIDVAGKLTFINNNKESTASIITSGTAQLYTVKTGTLTLDGITVIKSGGNACALANRGTTVIKGCTFVNASNESEMITNGIVFSTYSIAGSMTIENTVFKGTYETNYSVIWSKCGNIEFKGAVTIDAIRPVEEAGGTPYYPIVYTTHWGKIPGTVSGSAEINGKPVVFD